MNDCGHSHMPVLEGCPIFSYCLSYLTVFELYPVDKYVSLHLCKPRVPIRSRRTCNRYAVDLVLLACADA